jgi:8-oxo-dGTP pyrophosphatase MutT (NUDIX family)
MLDQKDLFAIIKEVLTTRSPRGIPDSEASYIHAAVLLPLFKEDGECKVLFTQRTSRVEHHKGQISFPGGAVDEEDGSLEETVMREAYEEIGLHRDDVDIIGRLDDTVTVVSSFIIHPFVGCIPYPYAFKINTREVERLIRVPLKVFLMEPSEYKRATFEFEGVTYQTPAYVYHGDTIWGATARIMENFIHLLREKLGLSMEGG